MATWGGGGREDGAGEEGDKKDGDRLSSGVDLLFCGSRGNEISTWGEMLRASDYLSSRCKAAIVRCLIEMRLIDGSGNMKALRENINIPRGSRGNRKWTVKSPH